MAYKSHRRFTKDKGKLKNTIAKDDQTRKDDSQ
jgi:hypothetical protein